MIVETYAQFVDTLNRLGFLLLGGGKSGGLLQLCHIVPESNWFTGDERDPWHWRRRLVEERDGAYARVLGGGYLMMANSYHASFIAAYTPEEDMETRYERGEVDAVTIRMYRLFSEEPVWPRHALREKTGAQNASQLDRALRRLQEEMYITVSGESQKLSWDFKPVGWPSTEYTRLDAWADEDILRAAAQMDGREARQRLRKQAGIISPNADARLLDRLFKV